MYLNEYVVDYHKLGHHNQPLASNSTTTTVISTHTTTVNSASTIIKSFHRGWPLVNHPNNNSVKISVSDKDSEYTTRMRLKFLIQMMIFDCRRRRRNIIGFDFDKNVFDREGFRRRCACRSDSTSTEPPPPSKVVVVVTTAAVRGFQRPFRREKEGKLKRKEDRERKKEIWDYWGLEVEDQID